MVRNTVIVFLVAVLTVTLAASQATDSALVRFGRVGHPLTDAEVVEITELAISAGKRPWLLLGLPSMNPRLKQVTLYLEPDVTGARVRRGRMLRLVADQPPIVPARSAWRVRQTDSYACIAVPGRRLGEVSSESDIGWPFAVEGEFDDETLAGIVAFIRSRPQLPGVPEGLGPREVAGAPISAVARRGDMIIVALRIGEATVERIWLAGSDRRWVITNYDLSIW